MIRSIWLAVLGLLLLAAGSAQAASLEQIGGEFDQPTYVTSDPGNPERLFVVEREGQIEQLQAGARTPFADLRSLVRCCEGDSGLFSIALAPDFDTSGRFFVDYTGKEEPGEVRVAEMRASGTSAPLSSLRSVLTIPHDPEDHENGGQLQFGPEGNLFVSTGDGGNNGNDEYHYAQSLDNLLGKILRINPDPSGVLAYTVPAGNPFPSNPIWSYGLRNPFRFSFDRLSGGMLIGDVGEKQREEVDYAPPGGGAGFNYGWNCREGTLVGEVADDPGCAGSQASDFVEPIFDYSHKPRCAIIGGYVVRDQSLTGLNGRYLYGDLCSGEIRSFDLANPYATDRSENLQVSALDSFGEDSCGRLYAAGADGKVFRLTGSAASACAPAKAKSRLGITAQSRRVPRGRRVLITAFVSPCARRQGEPVSLLRGGKRIGVRRLSRACTAHFRPRIDHRASLKVSIAADSTYVAATSRRLTLRIAHPRRRAH